MLEHENQKITFAEFTFETKGNLLLQNGAAVPLEPMAARVLRYLLESDGQIISKDELLETIWSEVFTTEDVLKRAVSQIRRALGDDAQKPRFIETHHRRGYRFIARRTFGEKRETPARAARPAENVAAESAESDDPNFDCFVGRAAETEFLRAEYRRVLRGAGQPVLIAGEPGIGKTQLTTRFADWLNEIGDQSAVPLRLRFFDYEAAHLPPYDLFTDLLAEAFEKTFGIAAKASTDELRRLIETKLQFSLPADFFAASAERRQSAPDASRRVRPLAECFARLSRVRPLVLILDDVQWADETSRQIIGCLMRVAADAPLMIVGLMRRGDAENPQTAFREWLQKQAAYRSFTTLAPAPLVPEDCRTLLAEIFRGRLDAGQIPFADLTKLCEATGGNPYFLVETIRLLLNEDYIHKNEFGWRWRGITDVPLPETVRMAARAKLVNLSRAARELIERAAILGDTFSIQTLELMTRTEEAHDENFDQYLDEAVTAQVLTEHNVSGADDCQFYHTTLRRAVYADLSPRRRKRLHGRAVQAIEKSHARDLERFAAALGAHAENAGDFAAGLQWNLRACRAAARRFDWAEAAELLRRAERIYEKSAGQIEMADAAEINFLALRGEVYMSVGRRAEAAAILTEAAARAAPTGDAAIVAGILLNLGRSLILLGKYHQATPVLTESLRSAHAANDFLIASAAQIQLASAKYALGEYEASCAILEKIIAAENEKSYNRAVALGKLGWTRALQSRYRDAKRLLETAFAFHQQAGDLRERAVLAMCLNWCEYGLGNYEKAIEYAMQARREAQLVGEPYNESVALMRVAKARIAQGQYAEAENTLCDVREKQKNLDAPHAQAETVWTMGRARLFLKNYDQAAADLECALAMIREIGDRDDEFRILIDQAHLANHLGDYAEARRLAAEAAAIARRIAVAEGIGEALIAETRALLNSGETEQAVVQAREAVRLLESSESGERWRAFHALAAALAARQTFDGRKLKKRQSTFASNESAAAEIETLLRRALDVLEARREEFPAGDDARRAQFTASHNQPALDLRDFLIVAGRRGEADAISRAWRLG